MSGWAAFWLLVAVFVICECVIYLHGSDTALWQYKTPAELEIQKNIGRAK